MFAPNKGSIYKAPIQEKGVNACRQTDCGIKQAAVRLGQVLPSLLDEGCELSPQSTINHYSDGQWQSWTLPMLRRASEEVALGLRQYREIEAGNRAALVMASNTAFVTADIGCLLAQLVTVPMSPEQSVEASEYTLRETAARVLFVSQLEQVKQLLPILSDLNELRVIVVAASNNDTASSYPNGSSETAIQTLQWQLPHTVEMITLDALRQQATWSANQVKALKAGLHPQDLATIVYTLTESGQPLGAMLSHENLSGSAIAAFNTLPCLHKGASEVALSFLPLHHIFARGFIYGSLSYGQNLYFSNPRQVMKHLRELKPTVFFTVPRLLEKVYEGWQLGSQKQKGLLGYLQQIAIAWGQGLLARYQLIDQRAEQLSWIDKAQLWAARRSVFRPIRQLFGGRLNCFISGGAALPAEVMTLFSAAGMGLCQGYGLTEASSTVSFTRRQWSRAGTVGVPMPGVEMALAPDGEVMVRAPYVMQGYYQHPKETQAVLEPNGWLHTGDRGEFSADGLLTLTGCKKELFKLSIGEYVAPRVAEQALRKSPLVKQALVVGPGRKFCGMLIFPEMTVLAAQATQLGLLMPADSLLQEPQIIAIFQALINQANDTLLPGSTIKRFRLIDAELAVDNHLVQSSCQVSSNEITDQLNREALYLTFAKEIDQLYEALPKNRSGGETRNNPLHSIYPTSNLTPPISSSHLTSIFR